MSTPGVVRIVVLREPAGRTQAAGIRKKIERLVREELLSTLEEQYQKVQVEIERGPDGKPTALVASMLRSQTYTADIFRVKVDDDYKATSIERLTVT